MLVFFFCKDEKVDGRGKERMKEREIGCQMCFRHAINLMDRTLMSLSSVDQTTAVAGVELLCLNLPDRSTAK